MKRKDLMFVGAGGEAAGGVQVLKLSALEEEEGVPMDLEVMKHVKPARSEG